MTNITDTSDILLNDIQIFAVHESDGTLAGFSFDAKPGTAEQDRVHTPIDKNDPGAELYLVAYARPAEAAAYTHGLEDGRSSDTGCLVRTFSDELTCVLVDFLDAAGSALHIKDMRTASHGGVA